VIGQSLLILSIVLSLLTPPPAFEFLINDASEQFDVCVQISNCETDRCEGKASVQLFRKHAKKPFQTLNFNNLILELDSAGKAMSNYAQVYGYYNSGLVFEDFNFDGVQDLAVRTGNMGAYNAPSYDVFLYSKRAAKFLLNRALTDLASQNLGLFSVDSGTKTISSFTKSGCCWHEVTRYAMKRNHLRKEYIWTEDATVDDSVRVTVETLEKGKWKRTFATFPASEYYDQ
jgi:hypothetical protein